MSEQAKKVPESTVTIPGELWHEFRMWVVYQGYDVDLLDDQAGEPDRYVVVRREPAADDMPASRSVDRNRGPWI